MPRRLALFAALAALLPATAAQPSPWAPPVPDGPSVSLELTKPFFENNELLVPGARVGDATSAVLLTLRAPVGPALRVVGELPVGYLALDVPGEPWDFEVRDFAIGNPYLGAELDLTPAVEVELGARLPLANQYAGLGEDLDRAGLRTGALADPDRFDAFADVTVPAGLRVGYRARLGERAGLRLRAGPTLLFYTSESLRDDQVDAFLGYSADIGVGAGPVRVGGGVSGRYALAAYEAADGVDGEAYEAADERAIYQAALTVDLAEGPVRPGVLVRVPLDDGLDPLEYVLGLRLVGGF